MNNIADIICKFMRDFELPNINKSIRLTEYAVNSLSNESRYKGSIVMKMTERLFHILINKVDTYK